MPELIIIAALDQDNGLGYQNHLLCHLHDDLRNFKRLTSGHTVVMGHKTWDSLSVKPLPNRKNIILTRQPNASFKDSIASVSLDDVLEKCRDDEKVFIIGGADIYRQFIPVVDRLIITHIHHHFVSDVFFPVIENDIWVKINGSEHPIDEKHAYVFTINEYLRRNNIQ